MKKYLKHFLTNLGQSFKILSVAALLVIMVPVFVTVAAVLVVNAIYPFDGVLTNE